MTVTERSTANSQARRLRVIVIGAGLAGVMSAIKLEQAGIRDVVILEKAGTLGGTWRDNTYPGVACDVPSHLYSYSFAQNPEWSRRFASGSEIQAYIHEVAQRYGVTKRIRYSKPVSRCEFRDGRWSVETADGGWEVADVVIAATGVTHSPRVPHIAGRENFSGAQFHSARWDHAVKVDGARIGVIGTGASAVQLVSALVGRVAKLTLFQRTAQWVMPQENAPYPEEVRARFRLDPSVMLEVRNEIARRFKEGFSDAVIDADSAAMKTIETTCLEHLESQVRDPQLRAKLTPKDRAGCKRLIMSGDFYAALQRPNARLVTEGIESIEPEGIRTRDGELHELDAIVYATGFETERFFRPMEVIGPGGARVDERWAARPAAYLSVSIPGVPNFFMLNGPSSPLGNYSLITVAELQMDYILKLLDLLRNGQARAIAPTERALAEFESRRVAATKRTVWVTGCNSWYLDDRRVPAAWPWSIDRFAEEMSEPKLDAFELN